MFSKLQEPFISYYGLAFVKEYYLPIFWQWIIEIRTKSWHNQTVRTVKLCWPTVQGSTSTCSQYVYVYWPHWWLLCNTVAVCLTFVQFILRLKLCLYTSVHLLFEEFKNSLKSSLSTQWSCRTVSPRVGVGLPQKIRTPTPD